MVLWRENYTFLRIERGSNISPGGGGVQLFQGGGGRNFSRGGGPNAECYHNNL